MSHSKTQVLKFKSMAAVAMACALTLYAAAAEPGITLRELPPLPGGEKVAMWSMGIINEVPVFVRTARIAGKADDPCRPNLLVVQGETQLGGQYAEAAMALGSSALHRHCKGQVWYVPEGQAARLRADLRGEWHNAAGLKALLAGQAPKPLSYENLDFPRTAGSQAVSVSQLELEEQFYKEHRQKRPLYEANLQRFKLWQKQHGLKQHATLDQWSRNPFAYGEQAITSVVVFNRALNPQEVSVAAPRNQAGAHALLQQADAGSWKEGAWLVLIKPGTPKTTSYGTVATAQVLAKVACSEFDCVDQLFTPGQGDLPEVWGYKK
ncbi:MAG: hypothetical protein CFE38_08890 [Comamonadaceae bacterium PBBC1]|nr:MAG: hypothetical protein CFE38_08890 [Comamonadaceae bacterium PBBC1]